MNVGLTPSFTDRASQLVSVIIPVYNRPAELRECLKALRQQTAPPLEILVVDHGSTDETPEIARHFGATLLHAEENQSVNHCRNLGAQNAHGDILVFFDSDIVCNPQALEKALARFADPSLDAVVGVYSIVHRHQNAASQFKNMWIRYSYLHSARHIDWIFGAASAIRTESFQRAGGFDHAMMMTYGGEDLELGKRMARMNLCIRLEPAFEVEHLKRHTVGSLLANDIRRSEGFVRIAGQVGHVAQALQKGFANVYPAFIYSVVLSWLVVSTALAALVGTAPAWMPLTLFALYGAINGPFLFFFLRHRGILQTVQSAGILLIDHLACAVGSYKGFTRVLSSMLRSALSPAIQPETEMERERSF